MRAPDSPPESRGTPFADMPDQSRARATVGPNDWRMAFTGAIFLLSRPLVAYFVLMHTIQAQAGKLTL